MESTILERFILLTQGSYDRLPQDECYWCRYARASMNSILHPPNLIPVLRGSVQGRFGVFDSVAKPRDLHLLSHRVCLMHKIGALS